jgi:hypothetical protein
MSPTVLRSFLSAAVFAAATLSSPAQVAVKTRKQEPAPADERVQLRLAEVIAMLEEDELSDEQRQKARRKLTEIADRLKQQGARAAAGDKGVTNWRVLREDGTDSSRPAKVEVRRLDPEAMVELELAQVEAAQEGVRAFRIEVEDEDMARPAKAPRPPKAPKAPRAPKAPKAVVVEQSDDGTQIVVREVAELDDVTGEVHARVAERRAREEAERAHATAEILLERTRAEPRRTKDRQKVLMELEEADAARADAVRRAEKAHAAGEQAEVRAMIEEMREEMREIRELIRRIRERAAESAPEPSRNTR